MATSQDQKGAAEYVNVSALIQGKTFDVLSSTLKMG